MCSKVVLPKEWVEKAELFRKESKRHLSERIYWITCFEAQQAVELYLKAFQVGLTGTYEFTHDISKLLKFLSDAGIKIPKELYVIADALTPHYTMARYPGKKPVVYDEDIASRCVEYMEIVIRWVLNETCGSKET